jgi:hypothetical protein
MSLMTSLSQLVWDFLGFKTEGPELGSTVTHTCHSSYSGGGDWEDWGSKSPDKKLVRPPTQPTS